MTNLKLGKLPFQPDSRDLKLANYVKPGIVVPATPAEFGHENLHQHLAMLGNGPDNSVAPGFQGCGDCVFAGAGNETLLWNAEGGHKIPITGKQSVSDYSAVTGYRVGDDSTDQGTDVRSAMGYRRSTGIVDANGKRHRIGAYLSIDPGRFDLMFAAAHLFSAVGIGVRFPQSADDQFAEGKPWDYVSGSPILGGHYVPLVARRAMPMVWTWGRLQPVTMAFLREYVDEIWAVLSPEFLKAGKSPEGFELAALNADLAAL